jgi:hypothetical protein
LPYLAKEFGLHEKPSTAYHILLWDLNAKLANGGISAREALERREERPPVQGTLAHPKALSSQLQPCLRTSI